MAPDVPALVKLAQYLFTPDTGDVGTAVGTPDEAEGLNDGIAVGVSVTGASVGETVGGADGESLGDDVDKVLGVHGDVDVAFANSSKLGAQAVRFV